MSADKSGVQRAGAVNIEELKIYSTNGLVLELNDYLVELNIFEDIFSQNLYGNLVLSDSRNLVQELPIVGEELLIVKITTPTIGSSIQKTFRIFSVTDRTPARERNTQLFTVHFASTELFLDVSLPLFKSFNGDIVDVVGNIFLNYIEYNRDVDSSGNTADLGKASTPLKILTETENKVKFVSPGWSPFKCINWLASKAVPKDGKACTFLFWESSKAFYFGTIETIFKETHANNSFIGEYGLNISNLREPGQIGPSLAREYFIASTVEQVKNNDALKNQTSGYLANRLITLDVVNKKYEVTDYDHTERYRDFTHATPAAAPGFTTGPEAIRNPATDVNFYPIHPKLFTEFDQNVNEKIKDIYGNRKSNLLDLNNFKMNITVPGRTDVEVGSMMYFSYPALGKPTEEDSTTTNEDPYFSGYFLITAIHHRITSQEHRMTMEIVKDSLTSVQVQGNKA